jgi:hypothetical protein
MQGAQAALLQLSADGAAGAAAFKSFVQRAQLVITGLIHVSILLLPRASPAPDAPAPAPGKPARKAAASAAGAAAAAAAAGEGPAPGFPADGADLGAWQRVRSALDRQSSCGWDWSNCCLYGVCEARGAVVLPQPRHPVAATAAFAAARGDKEALVCNDYDEK